MPPEDPPAVQAWLERADDDVLVARLLLTNGGPARGTRFHIQQAIEKALKGALVRHRIVPRKTHNAIPMLSARWIRTRTWARCSRKPSNLSRPCGKAREDRETYAASVSRSATMLRVNSPSKSPTPPKKPLSVGAPLRRNRMNAHSLTLA